MMASRPRDIGTRSETAVVRYLQANGWPHAERRALRGRQDAGDVTGTPGVCWEVKTRGRPVSDAQITAWLTETEAECINARANVGVLVVRRPGANVRAWWTVLYAGVVAELVDPTAVLTPLSVRVPVRLLLADAVELLRAAGYSDPLDDPETPDPEPGWRSI